MSCCTSASPAKKVGRIRRSLGLGLIELSDHRQILRGWRESALALMTFSSDWIAVLQLRRLSASSAR
jgi:hypothetical protein